MTELCHKSTVKDIACVCLRCPMCERCGDIYHSLRLILHRVNSQHVALHAMQKWSRKSI